MNKPQFFCCQWDKQCHNSIQISKWWRMFETEATIMKDAYGVKIG